MRKGQVTDVIWFKMPRDVYWADPFLFCHEGELYLFFEEFRKNQQYGILKCSRLNKEFKFIECQTIIDEGVHMSFPFVFKVDDQILMLPESCSKGKLSIYACKQFPWQWHEFVTLLDLPCVDTLIHQVEGVWWLFYSRADRPNGILYARKNSQLMSGWDTCDEIEVVNDASCGRLGGAIHSLNGTYYRIGQNCRDWYGKNVVICKIEQFVPNYTESLESELHIIPSDFGVSGFHTLNSLGTTTVVDRRRNRLYYKGFHQVIANLVKKLTYSLRIFQHQ